MATGRFQIGSWKWDVGWGNCDIKYKSMAEIKKVKAAGKNDSRNTYLGRQTGEVHVALNWKDDNDPNDPTILGPINNFVKSFLRDISPRGPNAGWAWEWVEDDQEVHDAVDVQVEELETSRPVGQGKGIAVIKLSTWVPDAPAPVVTSTAAAAEPWSPGPGAAPPAGPAKGFAGTPVKAPPPGSA